MSFTRPHWSSVSKCGPGKKDLDRQGGQGRSTPKAGRWGGGEEPERWKQMAAAAEWGLFTVVFANVGVISKASLARRFWSQ